MRLSIIVVLVFSALAPQACAARHHSSELGFGIDLPDDWLIVDREYVDGGPDASSGSEGLLTFVAPEYRRAFLRIVGLGACEVYFHGVDSFGYISVVIEEREVACTAEELAAARGKYEAWCSNLSAQLGREVRAHEYGFCRVGDVLAVRSIGDSSAHDGQHMLQYLVPMGSGHRLTVSATYPDTCSSTSVAFFDSIIQSTRVTEGSHEAGDAKPN